MKAGQDERTEKDPACFVDSKESECVLNIAGVKSEALSKQGS